jgi:Ca2+-binding EF-hand superfamily protein
VFKEATFNSCCLQILGFLLQTIFFWIFLVRQILQYFDANPEAIPKLPPEGWNAGQRESSNSDILKLDDIVLSSQEQTQIKDIFDLFDTDGGGSIDMNEMDAAMFALGFQPSLSKLELKEKEEQLADQKSKLVTLEEFTSMMKGELMISSPLDAIWAAFSALSHCDEQDDKQTPASKPACSRHHGNVVTFDGLKRACREYDVMLSDEELKVMMDETDVNSDGSIDREEFMKIMHNAPWF